MKTDVYNLENKVVGETELPDKIFGAKWNPDLVRQVLLALRANERRPWAHAKGRGEVRGGGRKPWRQKGTGRARHGSIRSPLWRGGGKAHGPSKERDYSQKINKKMKRLATASVLSKKWNDKEIKVFDNLEVKEPKTKILAGVLKPILNLKKNSKKMDLLLVGQAHSKNLFRAARNLVKAKAVSPESLNIQDLLNHKNIFIDKGAISLIGVPTKQKDESR
ncbi:MAG: 50S ribosomal protein L4 [Candidatus Liptonbacteria bacterium]|nr:50S ribosomal protein L4 [Candidatus Liptonbacteria bacterium]